MALTATIYSLKIELSDMDRGVYETIELRIARQPSETIEYMMVRVLAYCLEYQDGLMLTEGVASGDEPAILVRDLTGRITSWIEVGMPDANRLHRGMKLAGKAAVYTHRDVRKLLAELSAVKIHRSGEIPIYAFDRSFVEELCSLLERRTEFSMSVNQRELYISIGTQNLTSVVAEHRLQ